MSVAFIFKLIIKRFTTHESTTARFLSASAPLIRWQSTAVMRSMIKVGDMITVDRESVSNVQQRDVNRGMKVVAQLMNPVDNHNKKRKPTTITTHWSTNTSTFGHFGSGKVKLLSDTQFQ